MFDNLAFGYGVHGLGVGKKKQLGFIICRRYFF